MSAARPSTIQLGGNALSGKRPPTHSAGIQSTLRMGPQMSQEMVASCVHAVALGTPVALAGVPSPARGSIRRVCTATTEVVIVMVVVVVVVEVEIEVLVVVVVAVMAVAVGREPKALWRGEF